MANCPVCGAKSLNRFRCEFCGSEMISVSSSNGNSDVINEVLKGVVAIKTSYSISTGFILKGDFIITNAHGITYRDKKDKVYIAKSIFAEFNENIDKNSYFLQILGYDIDEDIAILTFKDKPKNINYLELGDSDQLVMGQAVFTIGCPMGYNFSYIDGSISNPKRNVSNKKYPVIQTNMPLNNGNSGGPLCTINGDVVGISTFNEIYYSHKKATPSIKKLEGISFAVSEVAIKNLILQIIKGGK